MVILGIDPGLATTGYGIIKLSMINNQLSMVDYGCIETSAKLSFAERLEIIYNELEKLIKKYKPDKIAIEKIFFAKNVKTAMQIGEVRGVATLVAVKNKTPLFEFTPLQIKQALTGYGQASKKQIQKMVKIILNFREIPKPDDAADALAVAIICANTSRLLNTKKYE
ncbi:MAG: crossover junction endodeoxyribonuclease RuvC [Patescibacteria group bacterium]